MDFKSDFDRVFAELHELKVEVNRGIAELYVKIDRFERNMTDRLDAALIKFEAVSRENETILDSLAKRLPSHETSSKAKYVGEG